MTWQCKPFDELTPREIHQIYRARVNVFVVEQHCVYSDVDGIDLTALHLFQIENNELSSYCRIYTQNDGIHIGRVLVPKNHRGNGAARELMNRAIATVQQRYPQQKILIQAQSYLTDFYQSLGFIATSDEYLEDNIPHIDMIFQEI